MSYKIISSPSNPVPTAFAGSNPIHIQLEADPTGNTRYVQIQLAKQVLISGLSVETVENMALQSFSFAYSDRSVQYPSNLVTLKRLLGDKLVKLLTYVKIAHPRPLFVYFRLFKQTLQFLQQISGIRCWDSNPRPLEHESPPITTRPGLLPYLLTYVPLKRFSQKMFAFILFWWSLCFLVKL